MILEDQYKQAMKEKKLKEEALNTDKFAVDNKKANNGIKTLENQLEKEVTKYNQQLSKNKETKRKIDVFRKENMTMNKVIKKLEKECRGMNKKITQVSGENIKIKKETDDMHNQILALKQKHDTEKTDFEGKMAGLKEKLKDTDKSSKKMKRSQVLDDAPSKIEMKEGEQFSNPAEVLKERLLKWQQNNKEKKQLMDKYIRNVKIIEDAFEQIREQTGITSIDEIVTTFIKAEEQNYSLYNYVNKLNSEIDTIEEQNKAIKSQIQEHENVMQDSEDQKQKAINEIKTDLEVSRCNMNKQDGEINTKIHNFITIQEHVEKMVAMFSQSSLSLHVAQPMQYDEDTQFTDKNATQYLAELEEYIGVLITTLAYKNEQPNAAISSIPLEKLGNKDFGKNKFQVDVKADDIAKEEADADNERDELAYSGKELYQKFQERKGKLGYSSILEHSNA